MTDWTRSSPVASRLAAVRRQLPPGSVELACHAAVPVALDAGFLNLLRVNFFLDPPIVLPYEAEAALLLSPLCRELGEGLYEIDPLLRRALLASLVTRFGHDRVARVALLLERYTEQTPAWQALPELDHAQRLTALSHLDPRAAADWLARARATAGGGPSPLGREWFVAMHARLRDQPSPDDSLDSWQRTALAELADRPGDVDAARRLGELALLPGSDLAAISKALARVARRPDPAGRTAQAVLDSLADLVGPAEPGEGRDTDVAAGAVVPLTDLLGLDHPDDFDPVRSWRTDPRSEDLLRVPIGVDDSGAPVPLDLKESARSGMGPHGLCVGATGSGKSELLRTVVLGLAMTHPPDLLALLLVDYRGGATFAGLDELPHATAVLSRLDEGDGLLDRLRLAVEGELVRRQELLRTTGEGVGAYQWRRASGADLPPMPYLVVVIDKVNELLTAEPSFLDMLLSISRLGRALGVHLLLATQRMGQGRMRGLESYLSYRLGLRTFSEQESEAVLGVPDAYQLPPVPGMGYLKVGSMVFQRFRAASVSGPYRAADESPTGWDASVVSRMRGLGETYQIWLPPLPTLLPLPAVTGPLRVEPGRGLTTVDAGRRGTLRVPLGLLDEPREHRQTPFVVDLAERDGHLAVVGEPGTGKSVLLRTLAVAAAVTHTPRELAFYCVDLSHGRLDVLAQLPHVGAVAGRADPDRVRRVVRYVDTLLDKRQRLFRTEGLHSVDELRQLHRRDMLPDLPAADIVLVVNNYRELRNDYDDLVDVVQDIASRGPAYGVHLVLTADNWAALPAPLRTAPGPRIEFRLRHPTDSMIHPRAAANLPYDVPGRCLSEAGLTAQIALPGIDDGADVDTAEHGLDRLVSRVAQAWPGPRVPEVRMLPTLVHYTDLVTPTPTGGRIRLGLEETQLDPVLLDLFGSDQHLLVLGEQGSGKTSLLRLLVRDLTAQYSDEQVVFAVIDPRRNLRDVTPEAYLGGYAGTVTTAESLVRAVAEEAARRLPPDDVTVEQMRNRSWWRGPEVVLLCDDHDLVADTVRSPLSPLVDLLPYARDIGLHLVVTRRSADAGRAVYEPVLNRMRELGGAGLLLSGDRGEGPIWPGTYFSRQPPGRGRLVRPAQPPVLVQLAYVP